jgi:hypothetical protein
VPWSETLASKSLRDFAEVVATDLLKLVDFDLDQSIPIDERNSEYGAK